MPCFENLLLWFSLTNVYHGFDRSAPSRYDAFAAIMNFAAESGNAELVIPKLKQIDQLVVEWGASLEQTRRLYKLAHKILGNNNRRYDHYFCAHLPS